MCSVVQVKDNYKSKFFRVKQFFNKLLIRKKKQSDIAEP